jgi:O-antigen/teichoic acid export membrane protein
VLIASFPEAVTSVYVAVLRVRDRTGAAIVLNLGIGAGTVALSWLLIPQAGIAAVGWAFLAMETLGCGAVVLDRWHLRRRSTSEPQGNVRG